MIQAGLSRAFLFCVQVIVATRRLHPNSLVSLSILQKGFFQPLPCPLFLFFLLSSSEQEKNQSIKSKPDDQVKSVYMTEFV